MSIASTTLCVLSNIGFRFYNFGVPRGNTIESRSNLHNDNNIPHNATIPQLNDYNAVVIFTADVLDQALNSVTTEFNNLDSTDQITDALERIIIGNLCKSWIESNYPEAVYHTNKLSHVFHINVMINSDNRLMFKGSIDRERSNESMINITNTNFLQDVAQNVNSRERVALNVSDNVKQGFIYTW